MNLSTCEVSNNTLFRLQNKANEMKTIYIDYKDGQWFGRFSYKGEEFVCIAKSMPELNRLKWVMTK